MRSMPIRKILSLDDGRSGGITLPKSDLEADGVMTDGEIEGEHYACVAKVDDGTYQIQLVEQVGE
jgi:hypothetical protein